MEADFRDQSVLTVFWHNFGTLRHSYGSVSRWQASAKKGPFQWSVQIRRKGWPKQSATFRTKKDAQAWARKIESEMDRGQFVDQSAGRAGHARRPDSHYT